jgi:hypothetical protein
MGLAMLCVGSPWRNRHQARIHQLQGLKGKLIHLNIHAKPGHQMLFMKR